MKEFVWRSCMLQWRSEFADLEVLVPFSYLQCMKGDFFIYILAAFDTTECEIFPGLGSFLNHFYWGLFENPKHSCKHFFSCQKSLRGFLSWFVLFFFLILCHPCVWVSKVLDKLVSIQRMMTLPHIFIGCNPVTTVCCVVLCLYEFEVQPEWAGYGLIQM